MIRVLPSEGRVMVEGAAMAKKHTRTQGQRSQSGSQLQQGGIIDTESFIDISNVQLVCTSLRQGRRASATGSRATDEAPGLPQVRAEL